MKHFIIICAMFMAVCTYAQEPIWWGYFKEADANASNYSGVGTGYVENFETAIYIPANHPEVGNATIKSLKIWYGDAIPAATKALKVWISKELPINAVGTDYLQSVDVSKLKGGPNEIPLNTPYPINNEGIYVGYTIEMNNMAFPLYNGGEWCENSFFVRSSEKITTWSSLNSFGKLAMMLLVDNAEIEKNIALPADFGTSCAVKGQSAQVPVTITNFGLNPLTSISYTITTEGVTSAEKTIPVNSIAYNASSPVNIEFPADEEPRKYEKALTITKVNGEDNPLANRSATGSLITILEKPTVVPVVEEFTGTWCGWCPIGFDAMEHAHEIYGDNVILIAVHSDDPMKIDGYNPIAKNINSYPNSLINRDENMDPTDANLQNAINQQLQEKITLAGLQVSASWVNELKRAIKIETKTKFVYSDDNGNYGIAYIIVEDGMSGTGSSWAQANNLSNNPNYSSSFPFWYNSPSKVINVKYNHVAVACWSIEKGFNKSINSTIKAGETQTHNYNVSISSNTLIQNKENLKVIALLIDRSTGHIVNAAQTTIQDSPTGLNEEISVKDEKLTGDVYDLSGRKVNSQLQKGIYIVNGKKIMVK